ncbi:MAG: uroporphyrinogen decarboxylase [Elusimicrobiota bacterium]|jgi:uroporphyrinogen decarboxylase
MSERFLQACRRRQVDRIPVWFMRQAGRYLPEYRRLRRKYSFLRLAKTPELACAVTLQPLRRMPLDAAIIFSDILLPLEAMGARLSFAPAPRVADPVRSLSAVRRLREPDPREELGFVLEAVRLARRELAGRTALIGFAGAPFTLASYLVEGQRPDGCPRTKVMMYSHPQAWDLLMRKLRRVASDFLRAQAAAGAQALQVFDSWAGALSPEQYRRYVLPHSRWLLDSLRGCGVPVIHFGTGTAAFLEDFAGAGGDVVGVDWRLPLPEAFRRVGARAVQGNLDPALMLAPRPVLRSAVRAVLAGAAGRRGFIFNLGHGILPQTPWDNARAVVDWVHDYGRSA